MDKPQTGSGLLGLLVLAALIGMLWLVDKEVTQGKVTEFFAMFR